MQVINVAITPHALYDHCLYEIAMTVNDIDYKYIINTTSYLIMISLVDIRQDGRSSSKFGVQLQTQEKRH